MNSTYCVLSDKVIFFLKKSVLNLLLLQMLMLTISIIFFLSHLSFQVKPPKHTSLSL